MRLTIDTQKDSHEEIKKAIRMLSALVGDANLSNEQGSVRNRNIFDDPSSVLGSNDSTSQSDSFSSSEPSSASEQSGGIFGFFDNADKQVQAVEEKKESSTREDRVTEYY